MTGFVGANVDQLDQLAAKFDMQAGRIRTIVASSSAAITVAEWTGADIDRARSEWRSTARPTLIALAEGLSATALDLRRQADQQREASGGATGGRTLSPEARELVELIRRALVDAGESAPDVSGLLDFLMRTGVTAGGLAFDGADYLKALAAGGQLSTLSGVVGDILAAKPGAILGLVGLGISAHDLGVALGEGDQGATLESVLDLAAGGLGLFVPGAGLAWEGGKLIGEAGYNAVQPFWNTADSQYRSAVEDVFGAGADPNNLTPEQAQVMVDRYSGPMGIMYSISDGMRGAGKDFLRWVSGQ